MVNYGYKEFLYLSLFSVSFGVLASIQIFSYTLFDELAFKVISEQVAPNAAYYMCCMSAIGMSFLIAFSINADSNSIILKILVYISRFGFAALVIYVSIMVAMVISIILTGYRPPEKFNIELLAVISVCAVFFATCVYLFFYKTVNYILNPDNRFRLFSNIPNKPVYATFLVFISIQLSLNLYVEAMKL